MKLRDVAAIAGKPGLYKILKPTRTGVIVEEIGGTKKMVVNANQRISVLQEISIYVVGEAEESIPLEDAFKMIHEKCEGKADVNVADEASLREFMEDALPNYDQARVYNSDIKKLVNWYNLLAANYPEVFEDDEEEATEEGAE
ncbi:DUF5606 domain-containing protein [Algivirga pacifica]|uniref:DUF5606 domain-containing protein n=1 Tax=Algivirga pacifica TaxID=1162670 RepID=A0ABP9DP04_9BACT